MPGSGLQALCIDAGCPGNSTVNTSKLFLCTQIFASVFHFAHFYYSGSGLAVLGLGLFVEWVMSM